jgi:DNA-binding MarR family transcriptional regulator
MKKNAKTTREAIGQIRPFRSPAHEAVVALLLAAEAVRGRFYDLLAARSNITFQQYNVLRILRGAGPDGLPTLEIADRLIERTPGVCRLLDRLEANGLVTRERSREDRRLVICRISQRGLDVLAELDEPIDRADTEAIAALSETETRTLVRFLDRVRSSQP